MAIDSANSNATASSDIAGHYYTKDAAARALWEWLLFADATDADLEATKVLEQYYRERAEKGDVESSARYLLISATALDEKVSGAFRVESAVKMALSCHAFERFETLLHETYDGIWDEFEFEDVQTRVLSWIVAI